MLSILEQYSCRTSLTYEKAFESARDHSYITLLNQWTNLELDIRVEWLGMLNHSKNGPWFVIYTRGKDKVLREMRVYVKNPKRKKQSIKQVAKLDD
jgi:hypothetical protein